MESAGAEGVAQAVLHDRTFEVEPAVEQAERYAAAVLLEVAVVGADVHDGADAAAVTGREGALVEGDFLDGLGLEDGEDAEHVVHVVDRRAVEKNQVFVGAAAADVDAREAFIAALDARDLLQRLKHVRLAEKNRRVLDLLDGNVHRAEIGGGDAGIGAGLGAADDLCRIEYG